MTGTHHCTGSEPKRLSEAAELRLPWQFSYTTVQASSGSALYASETGTSARTNDVPRSSGAGGRLKLLPAAGAPATGGTPPPLAPLSAPPPPPPSSTAAFTAAAAALARTSAAAPSPGASPVKGPLPLLPPPHSCRRGDMTSGRSPTALHAAPTLAMSAAARVRPRRRATAAMLLSTAAAAPALGFSCGGREGEM